MNLMNDLRNFNEIFRKDLTYDNNKSHKKQGFPLSLEDTFFEKPQGVGGGGVTFTTPVLFVIASQHSNNISIKNLKFKHSKS